MAVNAVTRLKNEGRLMEAAHDLVHESDKAAEFFAALDHRPVCFVEGVRGGDSQVEFRVYKAGDCRHIITHKGHIRNCNLPDLFRDPESHGIPSLGDIDAIYLDGKVVYTREDGEL